MNHWKVTRKLEDVAVIPVYFTLHKNPFIEKGKERKGSTTLVETHMHDHTHIPAASIAAFAKCFFGD